MRVSRISVLASVATGATLAFAGAAGGSPWSASSKILASTYKPYQVPHAAPAHPTGVSIPTNMRVVEVLTSLGIYNNNAERTSADIETTRSTSAGAITKQSANRAVTDVVHWWGTPMHQVQLTLNPTTVDVSSTSVSEGTATSAWAAPLTMPLVPLQATTGHDTFFHHNSERKYHQRSKSRQKPPLQPNQFLARFSVVLHYLADVITAEVVCAFLFGRWALRYYQRNRMNRTRRRRRRSLRRWSRFASRMCLALRNALPLNRAAPFNVQEDRGEIVTDGPSAAEVDIMPPAGDCVATSTPARGTAIGLVEGALHIIDEDPTATAACRESLPLSTAASAPTSPLTDQVLSTEHAANIEPTTDDIPQLHSPAISLPLAAVASTFETSPPVGQLTTEASLASEPSSTSTGRDHGTAVCPQSPEASRCTTGTAHSAGDAATQQASHRFIGWEKIGRDAYYAHSYELQMANLDHIQDFPSFQCKARVFMAGFSSGLGIE